MSIQKTIPTLTQLRMDTREDTVENVVGLEREYPTERDGMPDSLRDYTDDELQVLVKELEARAEQFSSQVRQEMNDELRRRGLPLIGFGTSRY